MNFKFIVNHTFIFPAEGVWYVKFTEDVINVKWCLAPKLVQPIHPGAGLIHIPNLSMVVKAYADRTTVRS